MLTPPPTGITAFLVAGNAASKEQIAAGLANPDGLARRHGISRDVVVFNLEWWRMRG